MTSSRWTFLDVLVRLLFKSDPLSPSDFHFNPLCPPELENLNKDKEENSNFEDLSSEIANLKAEREEEKKELQTLYDQLSSALAVSVEEV